MNITEVRSFLILAGQLHFGRAARLLHLSQPALTKQIRRLEEELGGPLLVRGARSAQLSFLGRSFLEGARVLVQDWDNLVAYSRRISRGESGRLRLGFGFHTFEVVPRAIVLLREKHPDVEISLKDMSTVEQIDGLLGQKIDLGFIRATNVGKLTTTPLMKDRMMLVTSFAQRFPASLALAQLKDQPFVLISSQRSSTFNRHALELCARHGFRPRVVQEVPEITTVLALVRAGLGVSMIPESFPHNRFEGIRSHRITDRAAEWTVAAAWRKDDSNPLIPQFLRLLKPSVRGGDDTQRQSIRFPSTQG
jgi:DNA-binding transcriptional LysR family regulator